MHNSCKENLNKMGVFLDTIQEMHAHRIMYRMSYAVVAFSLLFFFFFPSHRWAIYFRLPWPVHNAITDRSHKVQQVHDIVFILSLALNPNTSLNNHRMHVSWLPIKRILVPGPFGTKVSSPFLLCSMVTLRITKPFNSLNWQGLRQGMLQSLGNF